MGGRTGRSQYPREPAAIYQAARAGAATVLGVASAALSLTAPMTCGSNRYLALGVTSPREERLRRIVWLHGPRPAGGAPRDLPYLFCTCSGAFERFERIEFRRNPSDQACFRKPVKFDSRLLQHLSRSAAVTRPS